MPPAKAAKNEPSSPAKSSYDSLTSQQKTKTLGHVLHYILSTNTARGVVRMEELRKSEVLPKELLAKAVLQNILEDVKKLCKQKFGLQLVHIESKGYLVVKNALKYHVATDDDDGMDVDGQEPALEDDMLPSLQDPPLTFDNQHSANQTLLFNALTFLFMTEPRSTSVPAKHLENYMSKIGVDLTKNVNHPTFGDAKKLIAPNNLAQFMRQGWLEWKENLMPHDQKEYLYCWGQRAEKMVPKMKILELHCRIMNRANTATKPEDWMEHYLVAQEQL